MKDYYPKIRKIKHSQCLGREKEWKMCVNYFFWEAFLSLKFFLSQIMRKDSLWFRVPGFPVFTGSVFFFYHLHHEIYYVNCDFIEVCVNFCCTEKWFNFKYASFFHLLFHYGLSQSIECRPLWSTEGPCLFILYEIIYICWFQT